MCIRDRYVTDWKATDFFWALSIHQSTCRAAIASPASLLLYPCPSSPTHLCRHLPNKTNKLLQNKISPGAVFIYFHSYLFGILLTLWHLGSEWNSKKLPKVESSFWSWESIHSSLPLLFYMCDAEIKFYWMVRGLHHHVVLVKPCAWHDPNPSYLNLTTFFSFLACLLYTSDAADE